MLPIVFFSVVAVLAVSCAFVLIRLFLYRLRITRAELRIIRAFEDKANKIPALVETMRRHTSNDEIFEVVVSRYEQVTMGKIESIYDLLEINAELQRDLIFLFRMSMKLRDIHRDGTFVYMRDCILFIETNIRREIDTFNHLSKSYNRLLAYKNWTIFGIFVPIGDVIEVK